MLKRLFIYLMPVTSLSSCLLLKSPTGKREFGGNVKTCVADSTSILGNSTITIFEGSNFNDSCPNRPDFKNDLEMSRVWPVYIYFRFTDKEYWYMFDPKPEFDGNKLKTVSFKTHNGNFTFDKKKKTIKMTSIDFPWEKTFKYNYDKKTKTLTLNELKKNLQ